MDIDFRDADEIYHVETPTRRDTFARFGKKVIWFEWAEGPGGVRLPIPVTPTNDELSSVEEASYAVNKMVNDFRRAAESEWQRYQTSQGAPEVFDTLPHMSKYGFTGTGQRWRIPDDSS